MSKKIFILFLFFGCIGITAEIFFTAIYDLLKIWNTPEFNLRLKGQSYIWMFPIYGCISFMGELLIRKVLHYNVLLRCFIYAVIIYLFEFTAGWLLDVLTGSCPWEYKEGWHLVGYIRFDYLPAWMGFGWMIEKIYVWMEDAVRCKLQTN